MQLFPLLNFNSNWQTVSAGRIGRGRIGSELADNFSLVTMASSDLFIYLFVHESTRVSHVVLCPKAL